MLESEYLAEAAVVGIPDELKGEVPLGICVLKHGILILKLHFKNKSYDIWSIIL